MNEQPTPQPAPPEADPLHKHTLLELFETLSLREWIMSIVAGLKMPADSGEYKWARLQMQRLWAPVSAVVVPVLALLLCVAMTIAGRERERRIVVVYLPPPAEVPPLDPVKEIPPDKPVPIEDRTPRDVLSDVIGFSDPAEFTHLGDSQPFTPQLAPVDAVANIRSPKIMPNIYGRDRPGTPGGIGGKPPPGGVTPEERAVWRTLRWLKKCQESDGCWTTGSGGYPQAEHNGAPAAMTGLAVLTYLAHNELPDDEEFGPTVERALRWLMDRMGPDGRIGDRKDNNNYGLPISAYALSEAYGMTRIPMIRDAAARAISAVVKGQNSGLLWNYDCHAAPDRNDLSYSSWCIQALKAAHMAGLEVEGLQDATKKAIEGLKLNWAQNFDGSGSFTYTRDSKDATKLSCAGVLSMQFLGAGKEPRVRQAMAGMQDATCNWGAPWGGNPLYYWYYYTQCRFQANDNWKAWDAQYRPQMCRSQIVIPKAILDTQGKLVDIGYWKNPSNSELCKAYVYNTTLCALTLTVPYRYLPTYKQPQPTDGDARIEDPKNDIDVTTKALGAEA